MCCTTCSAQSAASLLVGPSRSLSAQLQQPSSSADRRARAQQWAGYLGHSMATPEAQAFSQAPGKPSGRASDMPRGEPKKKKRRTAAPVPSDAALDSQSGAMPALARTESAKGTGGGQQADASAALDAHEVPAHEGPQAPPEASRLRQQARLLPALSAAALSRTCAQAQLLLHHFLSNKIGRRSLRARCFP